MKRTAKIFCAGCLFAGLWSAPSQADEGLQARYPLLALPSTGFMAERNLLPTARLIDTGSDRAVLIVSFKCPTELLGVAPPTIQLLHNAFDLVAGLVNQAQLLSFDVQQVCN